MGWLLDIAGSILGGFWKEIALGFGALVGVALAYFKGKGDQEKKGRIAAQKETIDAHKDRTTVEDRVRRASDDDIDRMSERYSRDKRPKSP
jgi:hypothetical protein